VSTHELTIGEKSERLSSWIAFVGANLIVLMTYFILWVENSQRLPIILAVIALQIVIDAFLLRWRNAWKRIRIGEWISVVLLVWFSWSCIHHEQWYLLPVVAVGGVLVIWRFRKSGKRNAKWN
jgi:hypothetical protein